MGETARPISSTSQPCRDQAEDQGLLDRQRIGPVVVADDDLGLAEFADIGAKTLAKRLDAQQVDLRSEQPAGVVLAKAGRLDQGFALVGGGIGLEIGAGRGRHKVSTGSFAGLLCNGRG
jgi:hypothetical protein